MGSGSRRSWGQCLASQGVCRGPQGAPLRAGRCHRAPYLHGCRAARLSACRPKHPIQAPPRPRQRLQEAQVLAHIPPHPHIVGYYTSWTERAAEGGEYLFHQLEKCDVSVGSLISLREPLREADVLELLRQVGGRVV